MNDAPQQQYIAVTKIVNNIPIFGRTVYASDWVSATIQFDLMDEPYVDAMLYIDDDQLYSFEDD